MAASQSGVFNVQEFTDIGDPLVGGRLYTYAFGTTTQKTAYTDHAGTIPQTYTNDGLGGQYIALNARGELPAPLYLAPGSYDIAMKRADGSTVWTRRADPLSDAVAGLTAAQVIYTPAGVGATDTTVEAQLRAHDKRFAEYIDVVAINDTRGGVIDSTATFQTAIDLALAGPIKNIRIPGGTYRFLAASAALDPGVGGISFFGDGNLNSVLIFEEGSETGAVNLRKHLFRNDSATQKGSLEFCDLQIQGTWTAGGYVERGGAPFLLNHYSEINIHDCRLYDLSWMGSCCEAIGRVKFQSNSCERIVRDMCRFRSSFNVIVSDNHFKNCDDDAVALHQQNVLTGTAIREGIIVCDNVFEDTLGVKILGGRLVDVHNNIFRRAKVLGVHIIADTAEGDVEQFGISVTNNYIYDLIARSPFVAPATAGIAVYSLGRKGSTDTGGIVPGENNTATGAFIKPFPYRNNAFSTAGQSTAAQFFVQVKDNFVLRTLPGVATYSTWGYGQCMTATGFSDALVADAAMRPDTGIYVEGDTRKAQVSGNTVSSIDSGITLTAPTSSFAADNFVIDGNILADFTTAGLNIVTPASPQSVNLRVSNNEFDGDPYHTASGRGSGGTWTTSGLPFAYRCENIKGSRFIENHIKNVCRPIFTSFENNQLILNNVVRCDPSATGFSTSNRGVGDVPVEGGNRYFNEIFDCNPVGATYGQQLNATPRVGSVQPSSGKWVAGAFVQNINFGVAIYGWQRLTTGGAHVAGTDWKSVALV